MDPRFFRKMSDMLNESDVLPESDTGIKVYVIQWQEAIMLVTRDLDEAVSAVKNDQDLAAWVENVGGDPMELIQTFTV